MRSNLVSKGSKDLLTPASWIFGLKNFLTAIFCTDKMNELAICVKGEFING